MQKITPFLWFDGKAEEAAQFYTSIFKNSRITSTMPGPGGKAMGVNFVLDGQEFIALNGGPMFKFTEAISLFISCETQEEIDYMWNNLSSDGGEESMCGWLKDKYGLSWQVVPPVLSELFSDKDRAKADRAMQAMLKMKKIDIAKLKAAAEQ
ncbi:MAG: VOC family protein [Chitinophagaceae bacterium]|nr:VOC family protein [Chitinophagaceae bacterium]